MPFLIGHILRISVFDVLTSLLWRDLLLAVVLIFFVEILGILLRDEFFTESTFWADVIYLALYIV